MPTSTYETLPSTVLAWKKANKLGRFDPSATEMERKKVEEAWREVEARSKRFCYLGPRLQLTVRRYQARSPVPSPPRITSPRVRRLHWACPRNTRRPCEEISLDWHYP